VHTWHGLIDLCPRPVGVPATLEPLGACLINCNSGAVVSKYNIASCKNSSSPNLTVCLYMLITEKSIYFLFYTIS